MSDPTVDPVPDATARSNEIEPKEEMEEPIAEIKDEMEEPSEPDIRSEEVAKDEELEVEAPVPTEHVDIPPPPSSIREEIPKPEVSSEIPPFIEAGETQLIPNRRMLLVEFPGQVNNPNKLVELIGGEHHLKHAYVGNSRFTSLQFRKCPTAHPTAGEMRKVTGLVIRVRTKRKADEPTKLSYQVNGIIERQLNYDRLVDFQYLPPENFVPITHAIGAGADVMKNLLGKSNDGTDPPLYLAPKIFCQVDIPFEYAYRQNPQSRRAELRMVDGSKKHVRISSIARSSESVLTVNWIENNVPTGPPPGAIEYLRRSPHHVMLFPKIQECFKKRPVWSRTALSLALSPVGKDLAHLLRILLPTVSFQYKSGPYRKLYIKFGYNVRVPPQEGEVHPALYQIVDLRLGRLSNLKTVSAGPIKLEFSEKRRPGLAINGLRFAWPDPSDPIYWERLPLQWIALFKLMTTGGPPTAKQTTQGAASSTYRARSLFMQYCDISDASLLLEVQKMASKKAIVSEGTCWIASAKVNLVRSKIQAKYQNWLDIRRSADNKDINASLMNTIDSDLLKDEVKEEPLDSGDDQQLKRIKIEDDITFHDDIADEFETAGDFDDGGDDDDDWN